MVTIHQAIAVGRLSAKTCGTREELLSVGSEELYGVYRKYLRSRVFVMDALDTVLWFLGCPLMLLSSGPRDTAGLYGLLEEMDDAQIARLKKGKKELVYD